MLKSYIYYTCFWVAIIWASYFADITDLVRLKSFIQSLKRNMAAAVQSRCAVITETALAPIEIRTFEVAPPPPEGINVKVEFAGICGTDPHLWKAEFPLPGDTILGHEGIGIVTAMHDTVSVDHASERLQVGDRVYWSAIRPCGQCYECTIVHDECGCPNSFFMSPFAQAQAERRTWATYSEYVTLDRRNSFYKVDKTVPPEAFIALGCALPTMHQAVGRLPGGGIQRQENVVVQGAGAVGLAALMMAKLAGARKVVVLEASQLRMENAKAFGADACIDVKSSTLEERKAKIAEIMGPKGVGLVIECSGVISAVPEGLGLLARRGKYLLIGTWAGKGEVPFDPFVIVNKAITIQGSTYAAPKDYHNAVRTVEASHTRFPLLKCITHRFPLSETQKGLEAVMKGEVVKGVIVPSA